MHYRHLFTNHRHRSFIPAPGGHLLYQCNLRVFASCPAQVCHCGSLRFDHRWFIGRILGHHAIFRQRIAGAGQAGLCRTFSRDFHADHRFRPSARGGHSSNSSHTAFTRPGTASSPAYGLGRCHRGYLRRGLEPRLVRMSGPGRRDLQFLVRPAHGQAGYRRLHDLHFRLFINVRKALASLALQVGHGCNAARAAGAFLSSPVHPIIGQGSEAVLETVA